MFNHKGLQLGNGDNIEVERIAVKNFVTTGTNKLTVNGVTAEVDITASNTNTTSFTNGTTFNIVTAGGGGTNGNAWVCVPEKPVIGQGVCNAIINGPVKVVVSGSAQAGAFLMLNGTNNSLLPKLQGTNVRVVYGQMLEAKSDTGTSTAGLVNLFGCGRLATTA